MPTKTLSEDLLDFLAAEDLITKTPTTPSVTFRSIEDPLPSYDDNFATLTSANVNKVQLSVNLPAALRAHARVHQEKIHRALGQQAAAQGRRA